MKKFYYVIDTRENNKCYSYVGSCKENENLKNRYEFNANNVISITPCTSRKQARAIVETQNLMYKNGGIYLFDDEPLF